MIDDAPAPARAHRPGVPTGPWRSREGNPPWERPALVALLALTAVAYLWDLGASGWANAFYSAAVQAATESWKALFFGSFDAANFITVDKPPAFLWVMDLSARLFGLSSWSILVPEALEGVACVLFLYATVRRWFPASAALLAGLMLALTPVATLMFRFNNPDALLVLLLTAAAYALVRALERADGRWLIASAALVGTAFLAKMLEAFVVVPAFVLVYLWFAPATLGRKLGQLALAAITLVASAGWWVAIVQLTPAADRPYIGSSQDNSLLNLIFGYNGFGRLTGNEAGSVGGSGPVGAIWGPHGLDRLFLSQMGGQISWLVPAALILALAALWLGRRRHGERGRRLRAALVLWLATFVTAALVFSLSRGIIHPYYTVALAPPLGALVGIGADTLWRRRRRLWVRAVLSSALIVTVAWAYVLLDRTPDWLPWLRLAVFGAGLVAAFLVAAPPRLSRLAGAGVATLALVAALAGPAAYAAQTVTTPHSGAIPSAGPSEGGGFGPGRFGAGRFGRGAFGPGGLAGRGFGGFGAFGRFAPGDTSAFGPRFGRPGRGSRGAFVGGLLTASAPGPALIRLVQHGAARYTWAAATVGANAAAGYQLATRLPVMAIGGFNGTDRAPTLAQFERYVRDGRIHYFIAGGFGRFAGFGFAPTRAGGAGVSSAQSGAADPASAIAAWVEGRFRPTVVDGVTLYDLTAHAAR